MYLFLFLKKIYKSSNFTSKIYKIETDLAIGQPPVSY